MLVSLAFSDDGVNSGPCSRPPTQSLGNNWELNLSFSQHIPSIGNSELLFLLFEEGRAREYNVTI